MRKFKQLSLLLTCCLIFFLAPIFTNPAFPALVTITTTADSGEGSLREAIQNAIGNDFIVFDTAVFPPNNPATIYLLSPLPAIFSPVTIDAANAGVVIDGTGLSGNSFAFDISAGATTIRGLVINRCSGSSGGGIHLHTNGGNVIQGNWIGTDISGTSAAANYWGIYIDGSDNNVIGGDLPGQGNVISGNSNMGIRIEGSANNVIQGNFIGTDFTGSSALGNGNQGIWISNSHGNTIGDMAAGQGNVISSNADVAVYIGSSSNNTVYGNIIGLDVSETLALGNLGGGVHIFDGINNAIRSNSIFANGQLGIDLDVDGAYPSDGVTPNDPGDADVGSNNLQNFPVLNTAILAGSSTIVHGSLNGISGNSYTVEFFSNTACDPSGNGEGQKYLGSTSVLTDGNGNAAINEQLAPLTAGLFITATATDASNNTSEFSKCIEVIRIPPQIHLPLLFD